jgi:probable phosphoglycerate mutase
MSAGGGILSLALIRHGATEWNSAGRIQGASDIPLSAAARAVVLDWSVPPEFKHFAWATSPLARARETAALLGGRSVTIEPRLAEMHWGEWEGLRLADLRASLGAVMAEREARGLDFQPPGGESPRQVQERLKPWLVAVAQAGRPTIAVTHKGVIRAALALAAGWDMTARPPAKLDWSCVHLFALEPAGRLSVARLNIALSRTQERG